jgi:hypothetical protein
MDSASFEELMQCVLWNSQTPLRAWFETNVNRNELTIFHELGNDTCSNLEKFSDLFDSVHHGRYQCAAPHGKPNEAFKRFADVVGRKLAM